MPDKLVIEYRSPVRGAVVSTYYDPPHYLQGDASGSLAIHNRHDDSDRVTLSAATQWIVIRSRVMDEAEVTNE